MFYGGGAAYAKCRINTKYNLPQITTVCVFVCVCVCVCVCLCVRYCVQLDEYAHRMEEQDAGSH